jgi:hypothetical protein
VAVALALLAAVSMWFYSERILISRQKQDAARLGRPRGNLSDLYPRWLGARELLLHGRNPYSAEITREIQVGYYGRAIDASRADDPVDTQAFAYPVYVVILLAPTVGMPFGVIQAALTWCLVVLVLLSLWFWNRVVAAKLSWQGWLVAVLLVLGSFPVMQGLRLQQLTILVAALMAASFWARDSGLLVLSGALMALATIKPHLTLFPSIAMLAWVFSKWNERWRWLLGFASTLFVLLAVSEYLLPGWMWEFIAGMRAYQKYTGGQSVLDVLLPSGWALPLRVLVVLYILRVCWRTREAPSGTPLSRHGLCLLLTASLCVAPNPASYNQILLLPAVLWSDGRLCLRAGTPIMARAPAWAAATLMSWPWLVCIPMMLAALVAPAGTLTRFWQVPLYFMIALPVAMLGFLVAWRPAQLS